MPLLPTPSELVTPKPAVKMESPVQYSVSPLLISNSCTILLIGRRKASARGYQAPKRIGETLRKEKARVREEQKQRAANP